MHYVPEDPIDIFKKDIVLIPPTAPPTPANLGVLHLQIATTIFDKILHAADLAKRFVPTQYQYIQNPPNKVAELSVLSSYIAQQLNPLRTHLMFAQLGGIPVSSKLKYFHHMVDRLRLLAGPLSNDYHFLNEPHSSRPRPQKSLKFKSGCIFDKTPDIKTRATQGGYRTDLNKYHLRANATSNILKYLCRCLTSRLVSLLDTWSMAHNDEKLASWLPKYSIEILVDQHRIPDLPTDFAVLMMAVHRYPQFLANIVSSNPIPNPAREQKLISHLRRITATSASTPTSSREIDTSRSKVILQFFLQEQSDLDLSSTVIARREKFIQSLDGILTWKVGVFDSWLERQSETAPEDYWFSEMVRLARAKMPFATCEEVLVLAQRIDREWDRILTDTQPGEGTAANAIVADADLLLSVSTSEENDGALEVAMEETTNQGLPTGVSRSPPPQRAKEKPVEKDVLRKVHKTIGTKRNDLKGRFGPGVAQSIYPEAKGKSKPRVVIQID